MKRNLYYHTVFRRTNGFKMFFLSFFLAIASWPRLMLEVFVRKNFGERYFSFYTAIVVAVVMTFIDLGIANGIAFSHGQYYSTGGLIWRNATWFIYVAAFLFASFRRYQEVKREPSVFDFARFSLSTGIIDERFRKIQINGKNADPRIISTILEPALFLGIGIVLALFQQSVGYILIFCSICYSMSYFAAYHLGDQFIMDKIDEMICNEEMVDSFVNDAEEKDTRGFSPYGRKPDDPNLRRKVVDSFYYDDNDSAEAF